jgi:hypothetical protein
MPVAAERKFCTASPAICVSVLIVASGRSIGVRKVRSPKLRIS